MTPNIESVYGSGVLYLPEPAGFKFKLKDGFRPPERGEWYMDPAGHAKCAAAEFPITMPSLLLIDRGYTFEAPKE